MEKDKGTLSHYLQRLDTGLYQFFYRLKKLSKTQRRLFMGLIILCSVFLLFFINTHTENNAAWLEGTWSNQSEEFTIKTKKRKFEYWDINRNGHNMMKNAQIGVNSSKRKIVLTKSGSKTEYHATRLKKSQLELQIFNNGKEIKKLKLNRTK